MENDIDKHTGKYKRSKFNIGYIGVGKYKSINANKGYVCWLNMLQRCYSDTYQLSNPTYVDCYVCVEWLNMQTFCEWYEQNYIENFLLDKDILVKGNKLYSPETCCFVPRAINNLFTKSNINRGEYPIGVTLCPQTNKFSGKVNRKPFNTPKNKKFKTISEAFNFYKIEKELWIITVTEKFKDFLPDDVYQKLINYKVEITD